MSFYIWIALICAAILEVGGDASIRSGLRGKSLITLIIGCLLLSSYGIIVNMMKWDFSKIFGVYVAFFAITSILFGKYYFKETIPGSTWIGLFVIICGALIIQFGSKV
jgi:small multidrug resistance family-3 protein